MDTIAAIATRRSARRFTDEPVSDADLDVLLRAAMQAPSATNERPWRFVVVRRRETLERLSRATPFSAPIARSAAAIVVCADMTHIHYPGFWVIDCAAAIENLLLAAHASGLGGVWIGVHPVRPFAWLVRRAAGLPRHVVPHSLVALGHPLELPEPVDRFDRSFVHEEAW